MPSEQKDDIFTEMILTKQNSEKTGAKKQTCFNLDIVFVINVELTKREKLEMIKEIVSVTSLK